MRIAYQNLQCVGRTSDPNKWSSLCKDLREFYTFPEVFMFVECGTSLTAADYQRIGRDLFAPFSRPGSKRWGFLFDFIDPHKKGLNTHNATESFAVFLADTTRPDRREQVDFLNYSEASYEADTGILGSRERSYGTRQLGQFSIAKFPGTHFLLAHPSPSNAVAAVHTLFQHVDQKYGGRNDVILVGDFNVRPDDLIPTRGHWELKKIKDAMKKVAVHTGNRGIFDCCTRRRKASPSFTAKELAGYYGLRLAVSGQPTHRLGELDYVVHTAGVTVTGPWVLDKTAGGSDHNAIYFDLA